MRLPRFEYLEPRTIEEEDMFFSAVQKFAKIQGLKRDDMGILSLGDYCIINVSTCDKCGSHLIFFDF